MEIEIVSFTTWRWSSIEVRVPVEANGYFVDALYLSTHWHWLRKTVTFELRGPRVGIVQFIERKLGDGTCRRVKLGKQLQRRLNQSNHPTRSARS